MVSLAKSEPGVPVISEQLDAHPWLLNCQNGTLDLHTGKLLHHRREHLLTKQVPLAHDPEARCPRWLGFLAEITDNKRDLADFLQRVVGYALTGDTGEQVLFFLHGAGANGKTTFLETVKAMLGDYGQQAEFSTFLTRQYDSVRNDVARLAGARFVAAVEAESGRRLSEVLVKQLTGGDTVVARFLYAEHFEFHPQFKLFLAGNHKPEIRGTDPGIWRRILLLPFTVTIPKEKQDKRLLQKLRVELPGILSWAVQGCLRCQKRGLDPPKIVLAATNAYRQEEDVIGSFLTECCVQRRDTRSTAKDLYSALQQWCEENGEFVPTQKAFGQRLRERGFQRCRGGPTGATRWRGIGLLSVHYDAEGS